MNLTQPKVYVPASKWEKVCNAASLVVIAVTVLYVIRSYASLPETIPIHFNAQGEADNWGNKATIFLLPGISFVLFISLYFLNKVPHLFNLPVKITEENARRIYPLARTMMAIINFQVVLMFSYATWQTIQTAQGNAGLEYG